MFAELNVKIIAIVVAVLLLFITGFGTGYHIANKKYLNFKAETIRVAEVQKAKVEEDKKNDKKITDSIIKRYNAAIASLRNNASSGRVYSSSSTPEGANETVSYTTLVNECKQTTIQLNYLQEWVAAQYPKE
jgi:hypothetical protein